MNDFKEIAIAHVFTMRYRKTEGGSYQQTMTAEEMEQMQQWMNTAINGYRNDVLEEAAAEFDKMSALGDTAASFAAYVRGMKR